MLAHSVNEDSTKAVETTSANAGVVLSDSERALLQRLRREERSHFLHALGWIAGGAFFLWLAWDAPFALSRFDEIPYSERKNLPYEAVHSLPGWFFGFFWVCRGLYCAFLDRKRRLLVKLASHVVPETNRNA